MPSNYKEIQKRRRSGRLASIKRTEQSIIIFKVFMTYFNENITKQTLKRKFSSFGRIKDFSLIKRQNRMKICKVTYYDPMSAAYLLRDGFIKFKHFRLMIKPCPSWEQPLQVTSYKEYTLNNKSSSSTSQKISKTPHLTGDILALNDYCLEIIFDYLDFKTQLSFSFCHERLEQIFINMICPRSIPQQLNIDKLHNGKFSEWEIWQFYKTAGQYIKGISSSSYARRSIASEVTYFRMIEEFCTNVQRLQLLTRRYSEVKLIKFLNVHLLTEIELFFGNITDNDFDILIQCRNLTSLGLGRNWKLLGDRLPSLRKLQYLSLYSCASIKYDNLLAACKNMNLKYLDIRNDLPKKSPEALKYCPELESLKMTVECYKDLEQIMALENLKSLEINRPIAASRINLTTLFEKCPNNLKTLKLGYCDYYVLPNTNGRFCSLQTVWLRVDYRINYAEILKYISTLKELEELYLKWASTLDDMDILPVVKNCLKLKRLCISGNIKLTNDFIYTCADILEKNKYLYNTPTTSSAAQSSSEPLTLYLADNVLMNINWNLNEKILIIKKITHSPTEGLLSNDLPFDVPQSLKDKNLKDDEIDANYLRNIDEMPYELK